MSNGIGKGKHKQHKTHALSCAKTIISLFNDKPFNYQYQIKHIGNTMTSHIVNAEHNDSIDFSDNNYVNKAIQILSLHFDGKEFPFISQNQ